MSRRTALFGSQTPGAETGLSSSARAEVCDPPPRLTQALTSVEPKHSRKSTPELTLPLPKGLGHLATQIASRGIGLRVIGIDHGSKKELVLESGAEHFIDFTASKDVTKDVMDLTGGLGAHAVVVLTAANGAYAM